MAREGIKPAAADREAMVAKAVALYEKFPAGGIEFAVRRVAADVGMGDWRTQLLPGAEAAIDAD